eukprot:g72241.t1
MLCGHELLAPIYYSSSSATVRNVTEGESSSKHPFRPCLRVCIMTEGKVWREGDSCIDLGKMECPGDDGQPGVLMWDKFWATQLHCHVCGHIYRYRPVDKHTGLPSEPN